MSASSSISPRIWTLAVALVVCGCGQRDAAETSQTFGNVTDERLVQAAAEPSQWLTHGGTYEEQRYSKLNEITRENVGQLGLAWFADFDTNLKQEGTPLFIDGVLYVSTAWSKVYAFDAATGRELWKYDPKVPGEWARHTCCGVVNRGIAAYDGKIFVGTLDGWLVALDAATGNEVWSVNTIDRSKPYTITGAPRIVRGKVLIGNGGADYGVRGYVDAYDAKTGDLSWRFYTVPGNPADGFENDAMRMAATTWTGEWWAVGGGGTAWDAIVYDPATDLVYIGVGNGAPWSQVERSPGGGDNLFISSIVAVKPETGEYVWHYQTTPGEAWDYTAVQPIIVADLTIRGSERHVLMQAPKNGFFYVLDALTGELLSGDAFIEVNWADGINRETGRPIERPEARYDVTGKPFNALPGPQGAHSWHPMAYSPDTNYVYIPVQAAWFPFVHDPSYEPRAVGANLGIDFSAPATFYRDNPTEQNGFNSYLIAWDPVARKEVWRGETTEGRPGGALATAGGLVFNGSGAGQEFRAYDAATGAKLWSMDAQTGVAAGPISFELNGRQFVAVSVGGEEARGYYAPNHSRLLVFGLGGSQALPPQLPFTEQPFDPPPATAPAELVAAGRELYAQYCAICHGAEGRARGALFPDLTRTPTLHAQAAFDAVVLQGARSANGMASFADTLTGDDAGAVRAYLIARANELEVQSQAAPVATPSPAQPSDQDQ
jgi:PQQ-dependent dehydrogenase (methanol/ethanol family)